MRDEEVVPAPADVAGGRDARRRRPAGSVHTPSMTGGCSVGGRRSCSRRSRGNHAAVTTSTCSPTRTVSAETMQIHRGCPDRGRRRAFEQPPQPRVERRSRSPRGSRSRPPRAPRPPPCPCPAPPAPGPSCQRPGRTARSRTSSTRRAGRVGAERDLGPLAARDDLEPVERRHGDLHRRRRMAHRAKRCRPAPRPPRPGPRPPRRRASGRRPARSSAASEQQARAHQSFTPPAEPLCSRRCCSARVSRSRRSMEFRICSAWLWIVPGAVARRRCGCGDCPPPPAGGGAPPPPPPPPLGGGGRRRSASSRFHLARAEDGCSSSAWRRRSIASSRSSLAAGGVGLGGEEPHQAEIVERAVAQLGIERLRGLRQGAPRDVEPSGLQRRGARVVEGGIAARFRARPPRGTPPRRRAGSPAASARSPGGGPLRRRGAPAPSSTPASPTSAGPGPRDRVAA